MVLPIFGSCSTVHCVITVRDYCSRHCSQILFTH
ncbi:hypothetical protein SLEP1_g27586 [Rubroshorea leprosula]|uniref:Uncharacterized protein n=1 Tax=Rubroshorea leprosula TaxID=152421 RepID=A0AAV5JR02_9ROSI|nr:hypothetical protein SLEP1_g27586 [Rubroshorea leprosula]